jgi:hypothetical protein
MAILGNDDGEDESNDRGEDEGMMMRTVMS